MFKLLIKIILACLFCLCLSIDSGSFLKGDGNHTFYFYNESSNAKIVTLTEKESNNFIYFKNFLKGESAIFYNRDKVTSLINELKATKIFCEKAEDFNCEYYYISKINDYVLLNGQKVNLHVCYLKDYIAVGTPLVFGSY